MSWKSTAKVCARQFVDMCQRQGSSLVILGRDSSPSDATEGGLIVGADVGYSRLSTPRRLFTTALLYPLGVCQPAQIHSGQ